MAKIRNLPPQARKLLEKMPFWYITQGMLATDWRGKRVFTDLQEDIIVFHFFSPQQVPELIKENNLSPDEFASLHERTFNKLEDVICSLVKTDLKQNVFRPDRAKKLLERFWQTEDIPLKSKLEKILIGQEFNASRKEFKDARKLQKIAKRHNRPWIYLKKTKPRKQATNKLKGVHKGADDATRDIIKEIEEDKYQRSKLVSIVCEERFARYILKRLEDAPDEDLMQINK